MTLGLAQGDSLSPLIFSLYIADIQEYITKFGHGIEIMNIIIYLLCFADDMVLLANNEAELQKKIDKLQIYFHDLGLKVNLEKTKVMVFRKGGKLKKGLSFTYEGKQIEIVKEYTYLGVPFSSSGAFRLAAQNFKKKGIQAINAVWETITRGKMVTWSNQMMMGTSVVQSVALYCSHIWAWHYMKELHTVQNQFIKRVLRLHRQVPGHIVRLETGVTQMECYVMTQALNFWRRMLITDDNRYVKACFKFQVHFSQERHEKNDKNNIRMNWGLTIRKQLKDVNFAHLWDEQDLVALTACYDTILSRMSTHIREKMMAKLNSANSTYGYYKQLIPRNAAIYLFRLKERPLMRLLAQARMNQGYFSYQNDYYQLEPSQPCTFCNLGENDNLFHMIFKCKQHTQLREIYIRQYIHPEWNENTEIFWQILNATEYDKVRNVALYIMGCIQQRLFITKEAANCDL